MLHKPAMVINITADKIKLKLGRCSRTAWRKLNCISAALSLNVFLSCILNVLVSLLFRKFNSSIMVVLRIKRKSEKCKKLTSSIQLKNGYSCTPFFSSISRINLPMPMVSMRTNVIMAVLPFILRENKLNNTTAVIGGLINDCVLWINKYN